MVQIRGSGLGNEFTAVVTGSGELLVRDVGSVVVTSNVIEARLITLQSVNEEMLGQLKLMNNQLSFITDIDIKEVEI